MFIRVFSFIKTVFVKPTRKNARFFPFPAKNTVFQRALFCIFRAKTAI